MVALQEAQFVPSCARHRKGLPPKKPFYVPVLPSLINGNVDPLCDFVEGAFKTPSGAIAYARPICKEHEVEFIIYKLIVVAEVTKDQVKWIAPNELTP